MSFAFRYLHDRNFYSLERSSDAVYEFAHALKQFLNLSCDEEGDAKIEKRCAGLISRQAGEWGVRRGYGFLRDDGGVTSKTKHFEKAWVQRRSLWIDRVHNEKMTGLIETSPTVGFPITRKLVERKRVSCRGRQFLRVAVHSSCLALTVPGIFNGGFSNDIISNLEEGCNAQAPDPPPVDTPAQNLPHKQLKDCLMILHHLTTFDLLLNPRRQLRLADPNTSESNSSFRMVTAGGLNNRLENPGRKKRQNWVKCVDVRMRDDF
jgi:hypothetical protein